MPDTATRKLLNKSGVGKQQTMANGQRNRQPVPKQSKAPQFQSQGQKQAPPMQIQKKVEMPQMNPFDGASNPTNAFEDFINRAPVLFDLFFDLPHPSASKDSDRARMIEPPEVANPAILSDMYEPTAISRLARFAFPEHDDHKQVATGLPHLRSLYRGASNVGADPRQRVTKIQMNAHLNKLDIYVFGHSPERHTFSVLLSDGETRLYGHCLRYLPNHLDARSRVDVGRRGVRAMVLLTRAAGGDRFYTAVLKTLESVMIQGDALITSGDTNDQNRNRAMRFLHGLHRQHRKKYSEVMLRLQKTSSPELDDGFITLHSIEYDIFPGPYMKDRVMPGDFVKFELPMALQAGFRVGVAPDDAEAPVLPLLRCLGPENIIRLMSALLCERRIILVSSNVVKLAACVRAASSLLAQGQLCWMHNQVPVLPPHLLSCLQEPTPYLVGILDEFVGDVELLRSLKDVLCVHLDKNQFKVMGKTDQRAFIPDILAKSNKETVGQILQSDLQQILRAENRIWGNAPDVKSIDDNVTISGKSQKSEERRKRRQDARLETDMAGLFARIMRGDGLNEAGDDLGSIGSSVHDPDESVQAARLEYAAGHLPRNEKKPELQSVATFEVCENERGEEGLRAALSFFFLVTHGDLGTMLSEDPHDGSFLLDRKKYMFCKKKEGIREGSPMFGLYLAFSGSTMLEYHLSQRIEEIERGRSLLMPRHRSLFSLCEKHLRAKRLEFNFGNIRKVVSKTTVHGPFHAHVERSELARARALALTSAQPFDGNVSFALSSLMQDCHQCDSSLPQAVAVIWSRLDDRRPNGWKHPLLGLHLLKNLLLHGPISILSYSNDGLDKVRKLRFYSISKNDDNNREVRDSAKMVWEMLVDRSRLFLRRKLIAAGRAKLVEPQSGQRWGSYLLRKVPFTARFKEYHTLIRPSPEHNPCWVYEKHSGKKKIDRDALEVVQRVEILKMSVATGEASKNGQRQKSTPAKNQIKKPRRSSSSGSISSGSQKSTKDAESRRVQPRKSEMARQGEVFSDIQRRTSNVATGNNASGRNGGAGRIKSGGGARRPAPGRTVQGRGRHQRGTQPPQNNREAAMRGGGGRGRAGRGVNNRAGRVMNGRTGTRGGRASPRGGGPSRGRGHRGGPQRGASRGRRAPQE